MSNHSEYLNKVLLSRVYDVAVETPLDEAVSLSRRLGNRVLLKRDDLQPVFSFKLRGAYNKMARLSPEELRRGVIAASAGNHAQGVALAARRLGCEAVIVMPVTTPAIKVDAVRRLGGQVVLFGESFSDAWRHTLDLIKETGYVFIPPFDDPDVIAGQGTIGMEILRQHPDPIHAIFVPIGGGGLAAGVAAYVKNLRPEIRVIGVEPVDSDAMRRSIMAGHRVELKDVGLFADGVAVKLVARRPSPFAATCWTTSSPWTRTPSAAPSRISLKIPAWWPNRPVRWPWPVCVPMPARATCATPPWWPWSAAPT